MKNWSRKFALACGIISLAAAARAQADLPLPSQPAAPAKTPAIAVIDPADASQWQTWVKDLGWKVIAPPESTQPIVDTRAQALDAAVRDAVKNSGVDPERVYLAGRADSSTAVFYTISRIPDPWAAAVMIGGSPEAAVSTGRIFAANYTNVPVLWISTAAGDQALAQKLKSDGVNIEWRSGASITNNSVLEWLGSHRRDEFPVSIDCETNSTVFGRCYWAQMTKFDASERNDVLPVTRVDPEAQASLDLGGFGFKRDDPGPGLLVSLLAEKYSGPLKMGDRIVELDGKPVRDARQYIELMKQVTATRRAVVMVQRGNQRMRVETSILAPHRDTTPTARIQARYDPETKQIDVVTRMVTELRVTVPRHWLPVGLSWNGLTIDEINRPGCILMKMDKEILHAEVCPAN